MENLRFDDQSKEVVSLFVLMVFSKRHRKHVLCVSIKLRKTHESFGELNKAVETLAYGSYSHSFSHSP